MIHTVFLENFKGTTADLDFGQLTIFRGASGSGKSTWLEAVRVAVLGNDPGYGKLLGETMAFASDPRMSVAISNPEMMVKRVFEYKKGKASQTIIVNGTKKETLKAAEAELDEFFGQFPMMLNPDEFFDMSDDKKIAFLFGLSNEESDSEFLRRKCIIQTLDSHTDSWVSILKYEFKTSDYSNLEKDQFTKLTSLTIDNVANRDAPAGRALTKVFSELFSVVLPNGQETLSMYALKLREDAESANRKLIEEKSDKMKLVNYSEKENRSEIEKLRSEISDIEKDLHARERLSAAKDRVTSGLEIHVSSVVTAAAKVEELKNSIPSEADKKESANILHGCEIENCRLSEKVFKAELDWINLEKKYEEVESSHRIATRQSLCQTCGGEFHCPKCGNLTEEEKLKSYKDLGAAKTRLTERGEFIDKIHSELGSNEDDLGKIHEVIRSHSKVVEFHEIAVQRHLSLAKLVKEEKSNLDKIEEPGAGTDVLKVSLQSLKGNLAERLVAEKNHQWLRTLEATISSANETIYNSEAQVYALLASEKAVKRVRDELTKSATGVIEEACNNLLEKVNPSFKLTYEIEDGKFDIRCVGVEGREVAFKTLSGGEKVLYLSAQLLALMTIVDPKLKILEVEMGELSGNLVPPFMEALKSMTEGLDVQVVLSSCHTDFEVKDDAWTVHQMGE